MVITAVIHKREYIFFGPLKYFVVKINLNTNGKFPYNLDEERISPFFYNEALAVSWKDRQDRYDDYYDISVYDLVCDLSYKVWSKYYNYTVPQSITDCIWKCTSNLVDANYRLRDTIIENGTDYTLIAIYNEVRDTLGKS